MRKHFIRILPGDRVLVELSPYDLTKGRITDALVLEVASGSGEHAAFFSRTLDGVRWQPSDADSDALASIEAWGVAEGGSGWQRPVALDVTRAPWPIEHADAMVCINMLHITPWAATEGLLAGAGRTLPPGAPLYLYGPFVVADRPTAASNVAFDQSLRSRDPSWGIRALEDVAARARSEGLALAETVAMPANNLSVIFRKT